MRNSIKLMKQLTGIALALTICTSQLALPAYSWSRLTPFATASDANSSNLAEKPSVEKATTKALPKTGGIPATRSCIRAVQKVAPALRRLTSD